MKHKISSNSEQGDSYAQTERQEQDKQLAKESEMRIHRRFACAVRVSVEIPFLPTMDFAAHNFSRNGMFLAFTDTSRAKHKFEETLIGKGKHLMLLFAVLLHGTRHQCQVRARITRVTQHGIGVEFGDPNPWQLAELVDMFSRAYPETDVAKS